jgi:hypothetical protein
LAKVNNAFEVDLLVRRAVDMLGIREELLRRPAPLPGATRALARGPVATTTTAANRDDIAERSLVSLMLRVTSAVAKIAQDKEAAEWFGPKWRAVVDGMVREWLELGKVDVPRLTQELPSSLTGEIAALALTGEDLSDAECARMVTDCLAHLRRKHFKGVERDLRLAIRAAEEQNDEKAKRERILEWQDLVRKERQLERRKLEPKLPVR